MRSHSLSLFSLLCLAPAAVAQDLEFSRMTDPHLADDLVPGQHFAARFADLNGDGVLDVFAPTSPLGFLGGPPVNLHSVLQIGSRRFETRLGAELELPFYAGSTPVFALGDVDGDGQLDVAIALGNKNQIQAGRDLILAGDGQGGFGAQLSAFDHVAPAAAKAAMIYGSETSTVMATRTCCAVARAVCCST